jgi:hypothetical protein
MHEGRDVRAVCPYRCIPPLFPIGPTKRPYFPLQKPIYISRIWQRSYFRPKYAKFTEVYRMLIISDFCRQALALFFCHLRLDIKREDEKGVTAVRIGLSRTAVEA